MKHMLFRTTAFSTICVLAAIPVYGQSARSAVKSLNEAEKTFNLLLEVAKSSNTTRSLLVGMVRNVGIGNDLTDTQLLGRLATDERYLKIASAHVVAESVPNVEKTTWGRMEASLRMSGILDESLAMEALRSFQNNTAIVKRKATITFLVDQYTVTMYTRRSEAAVPIMKRPTPSGIKADSGPVTWLMDIRPLEEPVPVSSLDDKALPVLTYKQTLVKFDNPKDMLKLYEDYSSLLEELKEKEDVKDDSVVGGICVNTKGEMSFSISSKRGSITFSSSGDIEVSSGGRSISLPIGKQ